MARLALGCDLGATNLRAALVSEEGEIVASAREKLADREPGFVAGEIARMCGEVLTLARKAVGKLSSRASTIRSENWL